jgi:hypothetical protein
VFFFLPFFSFPGAIWIARMRQTNDRKMFLYKGLCPHATHMSIGRLAQSPNDIILLLHNECVYTLRDQRERNVKQHFDCGSLAQLADAGGGWHLLLANQGKEGVGGCMSFFFSLPSQILAPILYVHVHTLIQCMQISVDWMICWMHVPATGNNK